MATNFYKTGSTYYRADNNQKILNLNELNTLSRAGGKEISAPTQKPVAIPHPNQIKDYTVTGKSVDGKTLLGIPKIKPITNTIDSSTLETGMKVGDISSQMPESTSDLLKQVEVDNAKKFSEGAKTTLSIFQQQLKDTQTSKTEAQTKLEAIEKERQTTVTDKYQELTNPFRHQMEEAGNTEFQLKEKYKKYSELANSLATYADIAYNDIVKEQNRPAVLSVSQGRVNLVKDDYNTKITLTKTAMAALSDDIALGRTFIDRGINAVIADRKDQLNFLEFVNGLLNTKRADAKEDLISATKEEKEAINNQIKTIQSEFTRIENEKEKVQTFLLDNAEAGLKAGVSLADDYDTMVSKVTEFYKNNPQYNPKNIEIVMDWLTKYPDANIRPGDSIEQAQAKIMKSSIYQKAIKSGSSGSSSGGFTPQERRKLQQAGLDNADYKDQLDYLYGEDSQSIDFYISEYQNGNPSLTNPDGSVNISAIPQDLRDEFFERLEEIEAEQENKDVEEGSDIILNTYRSGISQFPNDIKNVGNLVKSGVKRFLDLF